VAVGASFALADVHAAAGNAEAGLVALGWRGLWLTFLASAVPTILFTVTGVLGLRQARLSPPWVSALGWLSAAAHLLVLFTLAQRGPFAADGIIAGLVPVTTVIWILALAATLPRSRRAAVTATFQTGG
jgi:NADH:ubiquinone oxidoreductase subunit H